MTTRVQELARLSMLLALAAVIHGVEAMLPVTVLWFRFGFANIMTVAALYLFGFRDALIVSVGRVFLGSLFSGLFASPAFLLSLSGGVCSVLAMGVVYRAAAGVFSEVGVSVIGAVFHNLGQLLAAYLILIRSEGVLLLLPLMIFAAIATGVINGIAARFLIRHWRKVVPADDRRACLR
jgi:heptaprenyl diphosphate synthase